MSNAVSRLPVDAIEEMIDYSNLLPHELANLMPMIEGKKFEELIESVRKGLQYKIVLFEGKILDGRNRHRALKTVGHAFTPADFEIFEGTRDEAETKVIDLNMIRRQMTNKDKEEAIRRMILKYPEESNRGVARGNTAASAVKGRTNGQREGVRKRSAAQGWHACDLLLPRRLVAVERTVLRDRTG